jgi:hypothetical protein
LLNYDPHPHIKAAVAVWFVHFLLCEKKTNQKKAQAHRKLSFPLIKAKLGRIIFKQSLKLFS